MSSEDSVTADPNAGLSQSMAMNPLIDFDKMSINHANTKLTEIANQLRRDAQAADAANQAVQDGKLTTEEALNALLYECHILCGDDIYCHHPPEKVRNNECEKCGAIIPEIPGFNNGRRN